MLIAGGYNFTSGDLQSAELFNPTAISTFPSGSVAATERHVHRASGVRVIAPAGLSRARSCSTRRPTRSPRSGIRQRRASDRRGLAVAAVLHDGQVLIAGGGDSSGDDFQSAELFNPTSDTFSQLPASGNTELQTARAGAVAATLPMGRC